MKKEKDDIKEMDNKRKKRLKKRKENDKEDN